MSRTTRSIVCVLISVALFALISLLVKMLGTDRAGPPLHPAMIASGRFCCALLFIGSYFLVRPITLSGAPWGLHVRRSVSGWMGVGCLFAAAIHIPLADANAIGFLSIVVTLVLSALVLREHVGPWRWSAVAVAVTGSLLISRPGTEAFHPAALLAMLAAVFIGFEMIFIKQLSDREHPLRILLINNLIGTGISILVLPWVWTNPTAAQWLLLLGIGGLMALTQLFNILALQTAEASFVSPFWYAVPVFAAIYDLMFFGQRVALWSAVGIALIISAGLIVSWRERRRADRIR